MVVAISGVTNPVFGFASMPNVTAHSTELLNGELRVGGRILATYIVANGLHVQFTALATTALTNEVARAITYANTSDAPPATDTVTITFVDRGFATATGEVLVNITPTNDAPVIATSSLSALENYKFVGTVQAFDPEVPTVLNEGLTFLSSAALTPAPSRSIQRQGSVFPRRPRLRAARRCEPRWPVRDHRACCRCCRHGVGAYSHCRAAEHARSAGGDQRYKLRQRTAGWLLRKSSHRQFCSATTPIRTAPSTCWWCRALPGERKGRPYWLRSGQRFKPDRDQLRLLGVFGDGSYSTLSSTAARP